MQLTHTVTHKCMHARLHATVTVIVTVTVIDSLVIVLVIYNTEVIVIVIVIDFKQCVIVGPAERRFDIGGNVFRSERCKFLILYFEKLMSIKCNGHLV